MHDKSLENWIWDAACSIRGAKDAGKYKDYILPLIFTKRLCDVFDDELNRIAEEAAARQEEGRQGVNAKAKEHGLSKLGISPDMNALASLIIVLVGTCVILAGVYMRRAERQRAHDQQMAMH